MSELENLILQVPHSIRPIEKLPVTHQEHGFRTVRDKKTGEIVFFVKEGHTISQETRAQVLEIALWP